MCPAKSHGAPTPKPSLDPAVAAREYLRGAPDDDRHQAALVELARVAWSGEPPVLFYYRMGQLLSRLPWLVDCWVGSEAVKAIQGSYPYSPDTPQSWEGSDPEWRGRGPFTQLEGLILLARLKAPGEIAAQMQLARILDAVEGGLLSDRRGTARRTRRRHPLKDIFYGIGQPQTKEALAAVLAGLGLHAAGSTRRSLTSLRPEARWANAGQDVPPHGAPGRYPRTETRGTPRYLCKYRRSAASISAPLQVQPPSRTGPRPDHA